MKNENEKNNGIRDRIFTGRGIRTLDENFFLFLKKYENSDKENFYSFKQFSLDLKISEGTLRKILYEYQNEKPAFEKRLKKKN